MKKDVAIGIDIGGRNTAFGIIDRSGKCKAKGKIKTNQYQDIDDYIEALYTLISDKLESLELKAVGIGIGAPMGDPDKGTINDAVNLPWRGTLPIVELFEKRFKIPAYVTNDAKAATIGEKLYGGAKGMKDFVLITLGTGLGCGIFVNDEMVYGADGLAGEFGHIIAVPNGRACNCGRRGCLETYASATGVERTARELLTSEVIDSTLRDIPYNKISSRAIDKAAAEGDQLALQTFKITGEVLGLALANLIAIIRPEAIFLQGGVANAGKWFYDATIETMERDLLFFYKGKVPVLPSKILRNGSVLGASAWVWMKQSEKK